MAGFDLSLLLPLPLPLVFHSAWNFFDGASRTLPAHAGHGAVAVAVAPAGCTPWAGPLTGGIELLSTIGTPTTYGSAAVRADTEVEARRTSAQAEACQCSASIIAHRCTVHVRQTFISCARESGRG
jgi:hypothetical protein